MVTTKVKTNVKSEKVARAEKRKLLKVGMQVRIVSLHNTLANDLLSSACAEMRAVHKAKSLVRVRELHSSYATIVYLDTGYWADILDVATLSKEELAEMERLEQQEILTREKQYKKLKVVGYSPK